MLFANRIIIQFHSNQNANPTRSSLFVVDVDGIISSFIRRFKLSEKNDILLIKFLENEEERKMSIYFSFEENYLHIYSYAYVIIQHFAE